MTAVRTQDTRDTRDTRRTAPARTACRMGGH